MLSQTCHVRLETQGVTKGQGGTVSHIPDKSTFDVRLDFGKGPVRASSGEGKDYCSAKTSSDAVCKMLTGTQQNS